MGNIPVCFFLLIEATCTSADWVGVATVAVCVAVQFAAGIGGAMVFVAGLFFVGVGASAVFFARAEAHK